MDATTEPSKSVPTWSNNPLGENVVGKWLDIFLAKGYFLLKVMLYNFVVIFESISHHKFILLFLGENRRHYPFWINRCWIDDEIFKDFVRYVWIHIDNSSIIYPIEKFSENLKILKKVGGKWLKNKRNVELGELESIENQIFGLVFKCDGALIDNEKEKIKILEAKINPHGLGNFLEA